MQRCKWTGTLALSQYLKPLTTRLGFSHKRQHTETRSESSPALNWVFWLQIALCVALSDRVESLPSPLLSPFIIREMKPSEVTCTPASPHGLLFLQYCEVDLNLVQGKEFRITPANAQIVHSGAACNVKDDNISERIYTIKENDTLVLQCIVKGHPRPEIRWTKTAGSASEKFQERPIYNETLRIKSIQRGQGGRYYCKADNGVGVAAIKSIRVDVQCKICHLPTTLPQPLNGAHPPSLLLPPLSLLIVSVLPRRQHGPC
ncbi:unnamed protein product [Pleuronectes platessa]|uniref:Ig-like domain-containing protein n=1 Tax=Pleuronectes platessa TaxID=8262 RepID=A0A9N7Y9Q3_PLEPL|nr:unnamed protein product [Pleuronectes platessa]